MFGARLLARLSAVGAVARFQETAEELARTHALNASPDSAATQVLVAHRWSYATPASPKSLRRWWHCLSQPWLSCRRAADPLGMHCLQAKIQEVAACLTAVADSLAASGQAAVQPVNPIVSALHGQGRFRLP